MAPEIHLQPLEDPALQQVDAQGGHDPVGGPWWTHGPPGRTCGPVRDPHWSSLFLQDCTPWKGPTLEQFVKNCSPWEGLMLDKFLEDCVLWEGHPTLEQGRAPLPEEEAAAAAAAETNWDELTVTPIPHLPWPSREGWGKEMGIRLSLARKKEWGEGALILMVINSTNFPKLSLFCPQQ